MLAGPLVSGMAGALILSQHHNAIQCEKQDYLKHADQHLNLALKQMQAGLGLVDTTTSPHKRSKKDAASSAAPPTGRREHHVRQGHRHRQRVFNGRST